MLSWPRRMLASYAVARPFFLTAASQTSRTSPVDCRHWQNSVMLILGQDSGWDEMGFNLTEHQSIVTGWVEVHFRSPAAASKLGDNHIDLPTIISSTNLPRLEWRVALTAARFTNHLCSCLWLGRAKEPHTTIWCNCSSLSKRRSVQTSEIQTDLNKIVHTSTSNGCDHNSHTTITLHYINAYYIFTTGHWTHTQH